MGGVESPTLPRDKLPDGRADLPAEAAKQVAMALEAVRRADLVKILRSIPASCDPVTGDWSIRQIANESRIRKFTGGASLDAAHSFLTRVGLQIAETCALMEDDVAITRSEIAGRKPSITITGMWFRADRFREQA